jgi:ABC-type sugar transport system permease subunit
VIQKRTTKWFFLFPALLIYTVFRVLPIFASLVLSVFEWNGLGDAVFVGLRNFKELFVDRYFYYALRNNLKLMVFFVAGTVIVGLLLAYFVDTIGRGKGAFRIMLFMPVLLSNLVTGLIWKWALNPSYGLLNDGLKAIGMEHLIQNWLGNGDILVWIIIIMSVWKSYGRVFVMILAGIQGIPEEISEAAYIDGAKEWQRLWYITIPMLKPIMAVVITLTLINAFRFVRYLLHYDQSSSSRDRLCIIYVSVQERNELHAIRICERYRGNSTDTRDGSSHPLFQNIHQ